MRDDKLVVFEACGIMRVHRMGDLDIHALRGVDPASHAGERVVARPGDALADRLRVDPGDT